MVIYRPDSGRTRRGDTHPPLVVYLHKDKFDEMMNRYGVQLSKKDVQTIFSELDKIENPKLKMQENLSRVVDLVSLRI